MQLLYADESNMDPAGAEFFVYAGVAIPGSRAGELSARIDDLRRTFRYGPTDRLKFNTVDRPAHVTPEQHREIKRQVMLAAGECEAKLIASFILHSIARSPEEARRFEINRVCFHFDCVLRRASDHGLVLLDTFADKTLNNLLTEKFLVGLKGLPHSKIYRLDRILGFHLASIGTSNFCSLVDVVVGALRFCANAIADGVPRATALILAQQLSPMCIRDPNGQVSELSLFFSPKAVRIGAYRARYNVLREFFAAAGLEPAQEPN
jgi:hypothetical protein